MTDGRGKNIASLRNLAQFRGKTDEEILATIDDQSLANRVAERIEKLEDEFDLSDMKYHDRLLLERFMTLIIRLEDEEEWLEGRIRNDNISSAEAGRVERRLTMMRDAILDIQKELGISRLVRKDTVEDNPMILFQDIRRRAKRFLEERLCHIKCHKCGILLARTSFLYPQAPNELKLICGRCGAKTITTSAEAIEAERQNPYK